MIGMIPQDSGPEKLVNTLVIDNSLENFLKFLKLS